MYATWFVDVVKILFILGQTTKQVKCHSVLIFEVINGTIRWSILKLDLLTQAHLEHCDT